MRRPAGAACAEGGRADYLTRFIVKVPLSFAHW